MGDTVEETWVTLYGVVLAPREGAGMPWKELSVSDQRLVVVHQIVVLRRSVSLVARECGVSRKTAYKWCRRFQLDRSDSLKDRSRRPKSSPKRSVDSIEQ